MTYNQAFYDSIEAEATIKCTYVEIFDYTGKKCFSLQKKNYNGVLGTSTYDYPRLKNSLVPIRISEGLWNVMEDYAEICKTNPFETIRDGVVYVRYNVCNWQPKKSNKTKEIVLAALGITALLS